MRRPWWSSSVPEDGYIHANLSRHLVCAERGVELAALLLEGRRTELRGRVCGILALKKDYEELEKRFLRMEDAREQESLSAEVRQSFNEIFKAVKLSWARLATGLRVFEIRLCGRLSNLRRSNVTVDAFLNGVENCTPTPYLLPVNSFFPGLNNALIMEIPVGCYSRCVAISPCGRYIAAGAGADIVIAKSSSGEIVQRMQGHTKDVSCVAFIAIARK